MTRAENSEYGASFVILYANFIYKLFEKTRLTKFIFDVPLRMKPWFFTMIIHINQPKKAEGKTKNLVTIKLY